MITLSLDEFGAFEEVFEQDLNLFFVGGILYDDHGNSEERNNELYRIRAYYQKVIDSLPAKEGKTATYPQDLHCRKDKSNVAFVGMAKRKVSKTLAEFLQNNTFEGEAIDTYPTAFGPITIPPRKGEYYIYLILKSEAGKSQRVTGNQSIWTKDDFASNLYCHMATETIQRTVFQNPFWQPQEHFALHIASRAYDHVSRSKQDEYEKLSYMARGKRTDIHFSVMNADTYRATIERFLEEDNLFKVSVDEFRVEKIEYEAGKAVDQEFLYLADSVCAYLSFYATGKLRADNHCSEISAIEELCCNLLPSEKIMIFGYDAVDVAYSEAIRALQRKDYYSALEIIYEAGQKDTEFYRYYSEHWFSKIRTLITDSADYVSFARAVRRCQDMQMSNIYEQGKGLFIAKELEKMVPNLKKDVRTKEREKIFYYLYEVLMKSCCHVGNSAGAELYFREAQRYASQVGTDEFLSTRNMLVVAYCDDFRWDQARTIALEDVEYAQYSSELKMKIAEQVSRNGYLLESKARSQLGQVYAFRREYDLAEEQFRLAMDLLTDKSADFFITLSYRIHNFIDAGDHENYEKYAKIYFNKETDLLKQFDYIWTEGQKEDPIISFKFALYVYVKGIYKFRAAEINEEWWNRIALVERENHPMELVYTILQLMAMDAGDSVRASEYEEKRKNSIKRESENGAEDIIRAIEMFGDIRIAEKAKEQSVAMRKVDALWAYLTENFAEAMQDVQASDYMAKRQYLDSRFAYMYI